MDRLEDLYHKSYASSSVDNATSEDETGSDSGAEGSGSVSGYKGRAQGRHSRTRVERMIPDSPTSSDTSDEGIDYEEANLFDPKYFCYDERGNGVEAQEWLDVLTFFCGPVSITVSEEIGKIPRNTSNLTSVHR